VSPPRNRLREGCVEGSPYVHSILRLGCSRSV
jgi:hypothetical protein